MFLFAFLWVDRHVIEFVRTVYYYLVYTILYATVTENFFGHCIIVTIGAMIHKYLYIMIHFVRSRRRRDAPLSIHGVYVVVELRVILFR